ncbi:hypothetical protein OPV22_002611 [Ensete ventricosum]|uniref:Uncharacterized protein n=1 Tax=Ensete ventricosum TaxID=4639 RepID=A0AAV8RYB5_ENSVE|nr:hypothetical protein OPV22_002611 [Ensete ventricosum]
MILDPGRKAVPSCDKGGRVSKQQGLSRGGELSSVVELYTCFWLDFLSDFDEKKKEFLRSSILRRKFLLLQSRPEQGILMIEGILCCGGDEDLACLIAFFQD